MRRCKTCGSELADDTPDPIIDSPGAHVAGAPHTSRDAALALAPAAKSIRRKVLIAIANRSDGLMSDEMLERALSMKHQTVSSARNWLVAGGWLEDSRQRGKSSTGRDVVLWRLTAAAVLALREMVHAS